MARGCNFRLLPREAARSSRNGLGELVAWRHLVRIPREPVGSVAAEPVASVEVGTTLGAMAPK
jgi:hypothetical protein